MTFIVRSYRFADRTQVLVLLKRPGAIDDPANSVQVIEENDRIVAAAVGVKEPGGEFRVSSILLEKRGNKEQFHALLIALLEGALVSGFTEFVASTTSVPLMAWVRQIYPPGAGTAPMDAEGAPQRWRFKLPITDVLTILRESM